MAKDAREQIFRESHQKAQCQSKNRGRQPLRMRKCEERDVHKQRDGGKYSDWDFSEILRVRHEAQEKASIKQLLDNRDNHHQPEKAHGQKRNQPGLSRKRRTRIKPNPLAPSHECRQ